MNYIIFFSILLSTFCSCKATAGGLGQVAANIYEPVSFAIQLVRAVSVISGSGLILGSIIKYVDYRRNPVAVRLSSVIFMFIFGIMLIVVGFIPMNIK